MMTTRETEQNPFLVRAETSGRQRADAEDLDDDFSDGSSDCQAIANLADVSLTDLLEESPIFSPRRSEREFDSREPANDRRSAEVFGRNELSYDGTRGGAASHDHDGDVFEEEARDGIEEEIDRSEELAQVKAASSVIASVGGSMEKTRENVQELSKTADQAANLLGIWLNILKDAANTREVLENPDFEGGLEDARRVHEALVQKQAALVAAQLEAERRVKEAAEAQERLRLQASYQAEPRPAAKKAPARTASGIPPSRTGGTTTNSRKPRPRTTATAPLKKTATSRPLAR